MARDPGALTVVAPVAPGRRADLECVLGTIAADVRARRLDHASGAVLPFADLTTVHFARLLVADFSTDERRASDPRLVFCTDYDGDAAAHLDELSRVAAAGLARVFDHCVRFPGDPEPAQDVRAFIERYRLDERILFAGAPGRTVQDIREDARLRENVERFLADPRRDHRLRNGGERDLQAALRQVAQDNGIDPSPARPGRRTWRWLSRWHAWLRWTVRRGDERWTYIIVGGFLAGLILCLLGWTHLVRLPAWMLVPLTVLLGSFVLAACAIRVGELLSAQASNPGLTRVEHLMLAGSRQRGGPGAQGAMTLVTVTRRGWGPVRAATLAFMRRRVRWIDDEGDLAGIVTIHFARWVVVGRCLLFCSSYDGDWEGYLNAFIDRAGPGVNLLWSTARGFPPARFLIEAGAADEQRFKAWAHRRQVATTVWYSAYPGLSTAAIRRNADLRRGLFAPLSARGVRRWARSL